MTRANILHLEDTGQKNIGSMFEEICRQKPKETQSSSFSQKFSNSMFKMAL